MSTSEYSQAFCLPLATQSCSLWVAEQWRADVGKRTNNQAFIDSIDFNDINLSQVPAMKRRRMSQLTKMALHTSYQSIEKGDIAADTPMTIFASQHGELERTVKIINNLNASEDISPTDFSLSVHNSALGLFSINSGNTLPATTIAAGTDSFGFALLEAHNLLQRFPDETILLTCFDQLPPHPLNLAYKYPSISYSSSMLLSRQLANTSIQAKFKNASSEQGKWPLAIDFIEFLYSGDNKSECLTSHRQWAFEKL